MQKTQIILLAILAAFVFGIVGCSEPKQVVNTAQKTGMTEQERSDKKGD
jgi:PBP1b-binding outer membrane lipoprotein LpoB